MKVKVQEHFQKHIRVYKAALMALLPLAVCAITCAVQGYAIGDAYIPASEWNDELFYYKQVEGMVKYGYPYGYFGFNESHAEVLSFAAWSPVLVWPWLIWGILFGWNLTSPIFCNIAVMMIAVALFVWLVKPNWKQMTRIAVLFAVFPLFTRYMLSSMPECTCFGMLIVFFGYAYAYMQEEKKSSLVGMFIISGMLTLMRPYMIVFMLLPMFLLFLGKKWLGAGIGIGAAGATGVVYILIKKFLAAEYFTPLFDTTWITTYFREGLAEGWSFMWSKLYYMCWDFFGKCTQGIREGLATGSFFVGFILVMLLVGAYAVYKLVRKEFKQGVLYGHLVFCFFAMWMALLLMYKMQEGSKHLLTFMAAGLFALAMMEVKWNLQVIITGVTFVYLYFVMAVDPYDYANRFRSEELVAEMERTTADFHQKMALDLEVIPSYDNDVIWVVYDVDAETGEQQLIDYQILYGIPAGFGISCCYPDYIIENFNELQCRYIFTLAGGEVDAICKARGLEVITEGLNGICYRLN